MESFLTVSLGLGLAAAAGLRLFVPAFVVSLAAQLELVRLTPSFDWLADPWVTGALGAAMVFEVGAYFLPWIDNLLDVVALPAATLAGAALAASVMVEIEPALRWALAVIAGGGTATVVHGLTATGRASSSLGTAGLLNPVVTLVETMSSVAVSILSILMPLAALGFLVVLLAWGLRRRARRRAPRLPAA